MNAMEALSPAEKETLKNSILLSPVSEPIFEKLLELGERVTYEQGSILLTEGEHSDYLYVIVSGSTLLLKETNNRRKDQFIIATLQAGESVGEMRLVQDEPCSLTVKAYNPLVMLRLSIAQLHLKKNEACYYALLQSIINILNSRLRGGNQNLMVVTGEKTKKNRQLITTLIISIALAVFLLELGAGFYYLTHADDFCNLKQKMQGHHITNNAPF